MKVKANLERVNELGQLIFRVEGGGQTWDIAVKPTKLVQDDTEGEIVQRVFKTQDELVEEVQGKLLEEVLGHKEYIRQHFDSFPEVSVEV